MSVMWRPESHSYKVWDHLTVGGLGGGGGNANYSTMVGTNNGKIIRIIPILFEQRILANNLNNCTI